MICNVEVFGDSLLIFQPKKEDDDLEDLDEVENVLLTLNTQISVCIFSTLFPIQFLRCLFFFFIFFPSAAKEKLLKSDDEGEG